MKSSPDGTEPVPQPLVERLRGIVPAAQSLVGSVRLIALLGAAAGLVIWLALFAGWLGQTAAHRLLAAVALVALLMPAAGAGLSVVLMNEVLSLPARARAIPGHVTAAVQDVQSGFPAKRGVKRVVGVAAVLWRLRLAFGTGRGAWLRAAGLARLAKLASLPAILYMLTALLLCLVLIAAAAVTIAILLVTTAI